MQEFIRLTTNLLEMIVDDPYVYPGKSNNKPITGITHDPS